jgi:FkbM family methyltransferase
MKMVHILYRVANFLREPGSWLAAFSWPRFSMTSYMMVKRLARQGVHPVTVIDIGANTGQFAIACARLWQPKMLIVVEPLPEAVRHLTQMFGQQSGVEINACAIGDAPGRAILHVSRFSHSSSLLPQNDIHRQAFPEAAASGEIQVEIKTIDQVVGSREFKGPILLKLDVQGYELKALAGAAETLKRVDLVLVEASLRPMYEGEALFSAILDFLRAAGFTFARPIEFLTDPRTGEILQMDCLFVRHGGLAAASA